MAIDDVAAIAERAGEEIMKIYTETPMSEWEKIADFKADGSPLTVADKKVRIIALDLVVVLPSFSSVPGQRDHLLLSLGQVPEDSNVRLIADSGIAGVFLFVSMSEENKMTPYEERKKWECVLVAP